MVDSLRHWGKLAEKKVEEKVVDMNDHTQWQEVYPVQTFPMSSLYVPRIGTRVLPFDFL